MKTQHLALALTVMNIVLLAFLIARSPSTAEEIAPVLRGRALEIVDDRGKVRASIKVLPADPNVKMPDGSTGYPETVLLLLVTSNGRPNVKLATTEDGSALVLGGDTDPTHVQVFARGADTSLKLTNQNGQLQLISQYGISRCRESYEARHIIPDCCIFDAFFLLTFANIRRMSAAFTNMGFVKNMSHMMQHGFEKLTRLSNGFRPIDGARVAHGSDLA